MAWQRREWLAAAAALGASPWVLAQSGPTQGISDSEILLGTHQDLTGPVQALGSYLRDGMQLAVDDINAAGGVPGFKKVVLEEGDSGDSSTNTATQTVNRLLAKNVDVIIGAASSSVTLNVLDLVTSNGVLMISPANKIGRAHV